MSEIKQGDWVRVTREFRVDYASGDEVMDGDGRWYLPNKGWTIEVLPGPKPAEPTGLGAVVVDTDDVKYVRADFLDGGYPWVDQGYMGWRAWSDIDVKEVLSDGYTG
jgi:hypothetical protein